MITLTPISAQIYLIVVFALSLGTITYPEYAPSRGWPMGRWADDNVSWLKIFAVLGIFGSLAFSVWYIGWLAAIITFVAGVIGAFLFVEMLRMYFQMLAFFLPILVLALAAVKVG